MLHSFTRRAFCALLIVACSILVQAEPLHRRPYREPREILEDRTVAAAFQGLSFKFWNSVERSIDIKHDLGAPPQNDPRYQLIKRQGGSGIVTNSTPSVTPTPTPPPEETPTEPPPTTSDTQPTETPNPPSDTPSSPSPTTPGSTTPPASQTPSTERTTPTITNSTPRESTSVSSSTFIGTTTDENGGLVTYTSVVLVRPTRPGNGDSQETNSAKPSLQTNGAAAPAGMQKEMIAVLGGAVAVAMAL
ncbi:predicted protein [Uncinocarpus reesii 1704]|uniref:Uncharacterized protein n=1 Tax=Uncinocarpus reesii (strain UAMH 1704) TaxID=336963 RepID=C4JDE2_UNCRE|nr:uncharacterized protein UREG_00308 [Uncinocarpus reesii 1704]EEP75462.1 predicted protein [Uncinocarpus reesii 1704]